MKEKEIVVLKVEPGKHPTEVTLANNLGSLQKAVSIGATYQGLIEIVPLEDNVCLLCNEEGKIIGLKGNRRVGGDIIAGVFYIVGESKDGDLTSLSQEKMEYYKKRFWQIEEHSRSDVEEAMLLRFFCV